MTKGGGVRNLCTPGAVQICRKPCATRTTPGHPELRASAREVEGPAPTLAVQRGLQQAQAERRWGGFGTAKDITCHSANASIADNTCSPYRSYGSASVPQQREIRRMYGEESEAYKTYRKILGWGVVIAIAIFVVSWVYDQFAK